MGVLGYTIEHPVLQDWREAGRQLVTATVHFFFGPWREKFLWDGKLIDRERRGPTAVDQLLPQCIDDRVVVK